MWLYFETSINIMMKRIGAHIKFWKKTKHYIEREQSLRRHLRVAVQQPNESCL